MLSGFNLPELAVHILVSSVQALSAKNPVPACPCALLPLPENQSLSLVFCAENYFYLNQHLQKYFTRYLLVKI